MWKIFARRNGTPVDDRRHDEVTHLAHAIPARDQLEQIKTRQVGVMKEPNYPSVLA